MPNILHLHNVSKRLSTSTHMFELHIPDFALETGAHCALVGASGAGKTTLLHLIAGIIRADKGSIVIAEQDITAMSESRRDRFRAEHIGVVHQTFNLLQGLSARENVLVGAMFSRTTAHDSSRADALLDRLGLGAKKHNKPRELSVGEQQRVAVARALINTPRLILADEPTASVDAANAALVINEMRSLAAECGASVLAITHDAAVKEMFPRYLYMKDIVFA